DGEGSAEGVGSRRQVAEVEVGRARIVVVGHVVPGPAVAVAVGEELDVHPHLGVGAARGGRHEAVPAEVGQVGAALGQVGRREEAHVFTGDDVDVVLAVLDARGGVPL